MKLGFLSRYLRQANSRRLAAIGAAVVVVAICIGLFVKSYVDSGPTEPVGAGGGSVTPTGALTDYPTDLPSGATSSGGFFPTVGTNITLPARTITGIVGGGLTFSLGSQHKLVVTATSAAAIGRVGYLIPTGIETSYGKVSGVGTSWSMTVTVVGRPAYAAIFVQAGAEGVPITCRITVDGHLSNTQTTAAGPYGRAVCVG